MSDRPELNRDISVDDFRGHYFLKEELTAFCRDNGLPVSGGKTELTERIACFLETGRIPRSEPTHTGKKSADIGEITSESVIEENIVCSEKHRAFFKNAIGKSFTFNVPFQKWLKANAGKTYGEAVEAYHRIRQDCKNAKTPIDKQFEYNTYIRDFFADNTGRTLDDAIKCWKYKKSIKGHNKYERSDLAALDTGPEKAGT